MGENGQLRWLSDTEFFSFVGKYIADDQSEASIPTLLSFYKREV